MKYFKNINLFQESKLVNLQANEAELWEEPTPVEMGTAAAEQIIKDFDVRTDPEALSINHPDEVIFGVRSQMMQKPFRGTGDKLLSAKELQNERVINRLRNVYSNAPETYKHIVDEEYRRRADAQTWSKPWNKIKFALSRKKSIEEDIAADFFTFDIESGETHEDLRNRIYNQIKNLDDPKNGTFLDANNEPINLMDQNATNEYVVATGSMSSFRNERVVVRWHEDDYSQIRKKLEKAKLWGEFSRSTPQNKKAREFIHLKFRLSLLDKITSEEKTKLNNDRFNTERLQGWLDDDKTTQALHDPEMETFITDNSIRTYGTFENLQNTNPDLHREFTNKVEELRNKNKEKTLEHYLSKILPPEELAHMHDSLETRTMLAYLQGAAQDSEQGINVRNYLRKLAGVKEQDSASTATPEQVKELDNEINLVNYFTSTDDFDKDMRNYRAAQTQATQMDANLPPHGDKHRGKAVNEKNAKDAEVVNLGRDLVAKIWEFLNLLQDKKNDAPYKTVCDFTDARLTAKITNYAPLQLKPSGDPTAFLNAFDGYSSYLFFGKKLKTLKKDLSKKKDDVDNKVQEEVEPKQMDSRSLLTSLIKVDLKRHGVTETEKQNKHALFATSLAIARLENSEIYANANQHMVDDYESGTISRTKDSLSATRFFTPVLSAQDAIEHVVDTDPDLLMFSEITHASTRNDLRKVIDKYNVGPAKLKEFIAKLAFCIKGIEVSPTGKSLFGKLPYKLGRLFGFSMKNKEKSLGVRLLSHEVPQVENLINTLTLLSAEYSTKRYYSEAKQQAEMEPSKTFDEHYLDMIKQQTSDARELNQSIEEDLKDPEHPLKTHLDFHRMRDRAYAALDQVKYIKDPAEYERELIKLGVSPRELTRGMISLRTRRFFRKSARVGLTGLSLPFYIPYGIGLGLGKMGKWFGKEILLSEGTKKGSKMAWENIKATLETPQQIVGIPLFALTMALSWPTKKLREINKKLKD